MKHNSSSSASRCAARPPRVRPFAAAPIYHRHTRDSPALCCAHSRAGELFSLDGFIPSSTPPAPSRQFLPPRVDLPLKILSFNRCLATRGIAPLSSTKWACQDDAPFSCTPVTREDERAGAVAAQMTLVQTTAGDPTGSLSDACPAVHCQATRGRRLHLWLCATNIFTGGFQPVLSSNTIYDQKHKIRFLCKSIIYI